MQVLLYTIHHNSKYAHNLICFIDICYTANSANNHITNICIVSPLTQVTLTHVYYCKQNHIKLSFNMSRVRTNYVDVTFGNKLQTGVT